MIHIVDSPLLVFVLAFAALALCAWLGANMAWRQSGATADARAEFTLVLTASLTLLGLIIGFTFSMALSRYDLRKNYEEAEANAIGTEYVRTDLMPGEAAARTRALLRSYLDQRLLFYSARDAGALNAINAETARLQQELWAQVREAAAAQPTPTVALVVSGMNDVLNSQGYTQAAWWNRIPAAAWILMLAIAMLCNLMIGYSAYHLRSRGVLLLLLPLVLAIAYALIADIDSPRSGLIHVQQQNLQSLAQSLR